MPSVAPRPRRRTLRRRSRSIRHRPSILLLKRMWTFFALSFLPFPCPFFLHGAFHAKFAWSVPRKKSVRVRERSLRHRLSRLKVALRTASFYGVLAGPSRCYEEHDNRPSRRASDK